MVRAACVFVAIFCLIQGFTVCTGENWKDHESHEGKPTDQHWGHKGSDSGSWEKPWGEKPGGDSDMEDSNEWGEHLKNMDWSRFCRKINLRELLEDEEMMKLWRNKDWSKVYEKIREFMRSKHAWRHMYGEWGRHREEEHHRRHLALVIATPICGVILLAIIILITVKCVKKSNKRNGQKVPPPPQYLVGDEEKKLTPELAFGPAFGPGVNSTAPPLYTLTVPEEKKPEV